MGLNALSFLFKNKKGIFNYIFLNLLYRTYFDTDCTILSTVMVLFLRLIKMIESVQSCLALLREEQARYALYAPLNF